MEDNIQEMYSKARKAFREIEYWSQDPGGPLGMTSSCVGVHGPSGESDQATETGQSSPRVPGASLEAGACAVSGSSLRVQRSFWA